jgi:hypothetical protein|tara:strand:+ start:688 stop:918 length:231 start_codon:yes stop_codon:yes gene_type:complete
MNQPPDEILDEIKSTIRHLEINQELFSPNIILKWEKEYDTSLDVTNFPCFIYDTFQPHPIEYLKNIENPGHKISEK